MPLTDTQREILLRPIDPGRVKTTEGNSYVEAWDVRRTLNRYFGFEGWDVAVLSLEKMHSESHDRPDRKDPKKIITAWTVVYTAVVRLTIRGFDGQTLATKEDVGTGTASNQTSAGDAFDLAAKTAVSDGLKRAAANLGDQFGLSLYRKGDKFRASVMRVLTPDTELNMGPSGDDLTDGSDVADDTAHDIISAAEEKAEQVAQGTKSLAVYQGWAKTVASQIAGLGQVDIAPPAWTGQDGEFRMTPAEYVDALGRHAERVLRDR